MTRRREGKTIAMHMPRLLPVAAGLFYAVALHIAHRGYLNQEWGYYGFLYRDPGWWEVTFVALTVALGSWFLPKTLERPSSAVVLFLYVVVYVPTVVLTPCLGDWWFSDYFDVLFALVFSFILISISSMELPPASRALVELPDTFFVIFMTTVWAGACAVLLANYWSIISFAGLDEVYEQRAAGTSATPALAYVQTYFSNVLSPALIALGLTRRNAGLAILGTLGCVLMFSITAQRTVFLLPLVIAGFHVLLQSRLSLLKAPAIPIAAVAVAVLVSTWLYAGTDLFAFIATYLVFRTLGLPSLTYSQYSDVFRAEGYTYWSHVKGFDFFVDAPRSLSADPAWPGLGYIVGDRLYSNPENNVNANLFSGDGVAAAGAIGVLVISVVLACWLILLDRSAGRWQRGFAFLVTVPLGLSLTNGHLTTTLLSFGGLFWLLIFRFWPTRPLRFTGKPNEDRHALRLLQRSAGVSGKPPGQVLRQARTSGHGHRFDL